MEKAEFLAAWDHYMLLGSEIFFGLGILIFFFYEFKIAQIRDLKEKYDYVSTHEIQYFWVSFLAFIVAGCLYINTIATARITLHYSFLLYVRLAITVVIGILAYLFSDSTVHVYYPRYLMKRLHKIRNKPRKSPEGNIMKKLSEEEEDAHLDEHMIAEEASAVHSVDYDVWIDEKTGYKKVEKYLDYLQTEECPDCGYFTLKIDREEIIVPPSINESGVLHKHYKCSFCKHRELKEINISKLSANVA